VNGRMGGSGQVASIQWLRALAAMSVVMFHACDTRLAAAGAAGVDVFFVISGFIMWVSTAGRDNSPMGFLWRRLVRIAPAYWFFTSVLLTTALLIPGLFRQLKIDWPHVAASYLLIPWVSPTDGHVAPLLVPGWTLTYEMFFYVIFALSLLVQAKWRLPVVTAVLAALVILGIVIRPEGAIASTYTKPRLLEFAAGLAIARLWLSGRLRMAAWQAGILAVLGMAVPIIACVNDVPIDDRTVLFVFGLPASLLVVAGLALEDTIRQWPKAGVRVGDWSYSIYLVHTMLVSTCVKVWSLLGLQGLPADISYLVTVATLSVALGWAGYRFVELPSQRALRGRGGRSERAFLAAR
jgi:exopolysaccharide production protein ExoZ